MPSFRLLLGLVLVFAHSVFSVRYIYDNSTTICSDASSPCNFNDVNFWTINTTSSTDGASNNTILVAASNQTFSIDDTIVFVSLDVPLYLTFTQSLQLMALMVDTSGGSITVDGASLYLRERYDSGGYRYTASSVSSNITLRNGAVFESAYLLRFRGNKLEVFDNSTARINYLDCSNNISEIITRDHSALITGYFRVYNIQILDFSSFSLLRSFVIYTTGNFVVYKNGYFGAKSNISLVSLDNFGKVVFDVKPTMRSLQLYRNSESVFNAGLTVTGGILINGQSSIIVRGGDFKASYVSVATTNSLDLDLKIYGGNSSVGTVRGKLTLDSTDFTTSSAIILGSTLTVKNSTLTLNSPVLLPYVNMDATSRMTILRTTTIQGGDINGELVVSNSGGLSAANARFNLAKCTLDEAVRLLITNSSFTCGSVQKALSVGTLSLNATTLTLPSDDDNMLVHTLQTGRVNWTYVGSMVVSKFASSTLYFSRVPLNISITGNLRFLAGENPSIITDNVALISVGKTLYIDKGVSIRCTYDWLHEPPSESEIFRASNISGTFGSFDWGGSPARMQLNYYSTSITMGPELARAVVPYVTNAGMIAGIVVGVVGMFGIAAGVYFYKRWRHAQSDYDMLVIQSRG